MESLDLSCFVKLLEDSKELSKDQQIYSLKQVDEKDDIFEQSKYLYGYINFDRGMYIDFIDHNLKFDERNIKHIHELIGNYKINLYTIDDEIILEFKKLEPRDKYYQTDVNGFGKVKFIDVLIENPGGRNYVTLISNRKSRELIKKFKSENYTHISKDICLIRDEDEIIGLILTSTTSVYDDFLFSIWKSFDNRYFLISDYYFYNRYNKLKYSDIKKEKYEKYIKIFTIVKKSNIVEHINKFKKLFIEKLYSPDNFVNTEMYKKLKDNFEK